MNPLDNPDVKTELVQMRPEELMKKAKKEGARVYENSFEHEFTPWPRDKIDACMERIRNGEDEDDELKEFKKYHPTLAKMAGGGMQTHALCNLFAAHDDILSGKTTKEDAMKKLIGGIFANISKSQPPDEKK